MREELRHLWEHARWADQALLSALQASAGHPAEALGEFGHILGADEVWLARLEQRPSRGAVWPALPLSEAASLAEAVHAGYAAFLARLGEPELARRIRYTNSAGQTFENSVGDILLHTALHGQYHRGKINLLLRQAGVNPMPTDYIAFVRGAPAATTPMR